jgi:hypothetical protein
MAWIESHQQLGRHPKMVRLAARVRACRPQVIGHLHYLWWWAVDFAPSGDLSAFAADEIAAASEWNGDANLWLAALKEIGWIDDTGHLHDWFDYAGKLIERREKDCGRKRDMRRAYEDGSIEAVRSRDGSNCRYCGIEVDWVDRKTSKGGTYDHVDPTGPSTVENLVVSCRGCNSAKGPRTPLQITHLARIKCASNAASNNSTVPYPTLPNSTQPVFSRRQSAGVVGEYSADFLSFWEAYPKKKGGKHEAFKAWNKASGRRPPLEKILAAITDQTNSRDWKKDGGQFIPLPATWINQGRWEDEPSLDLPETKKPLRVQV